MLSSLWLDNCIPLLPSNLIRSLMVTFSFLGRFLWFYTFGVFTDSRLNMLRNISVRVVSYVFHVCICAFCSLAYFGSVYDWSQ